MFYSLPILTMKIIINDVSYDTQDSETICQRFSERVDDSEIEQVQEVIYRTKDGKYFNYIWRFHDSEESVRNRENLFTEYIRTMEPEDVILWLRIDGLARRFQDPSTAFLPIGNEPKTDTYELTTF